MFFFAPVSFKYKGSSKFQTTLGGVLSLLVMLILLMYIPMKMVQLINHENAFVSSQTVYHNLEEFLGSVSASDLKFDFAIAA